MIRTVRAIAACVVAALALCSVPATAAAPAPADNPPYQPISPACVYQSAFNTLSSNQTETLTCDNTGALRVDLVNGGLTVSMPFAGNADAQTATGTGQSTGVDGFNGTTWDRLESFALATAQTGISAPSKGLLGTLAFTQCLYSSVAVTATSGNAYPLQCDANGNLKTATSVTFPLPGSGSVAAGTSQGIAMWGYDGASNLRPILQGTISGQTGQAPPSYGMMWSVNVPECLYSTTGAAPTNGTLVPLQCNANGQILTTGQQAPLSEATSAPAGAAQGVGVQYVNGTTVTPVSSANPLPVNCFGGCQLPFNGTSDAQGPGGSQGLAILGFNGSTFDRIRSSGVISQTGIAAPAIGLLNAEVFPNCEYNTTAITASSGNMYPLQCDNTGALKVTGGGGGSSAPATPYPAGGVGAPPTAAPPSVSQQACYYSGSQYSTSSGNIEAVRCDQNGAQYTVFSPGGIPYDASEVQITASGTCVQVSASALKWGVALVNTASTQQTATITLYNTATAGTSGANCNSTTQRYSITLGASQYLVIPQALFAWNAGLFYTMSTTPSANVSLIYY